MTTRRRVLLGSLILLGILGGVATLLWKDLVIHRIGTVRPGVLYRSAQLGEKKLASVVDRYAVRTIVNLQEDVPYERALAKARGIRYLWLPSQQVPSPANRTAFLALFDDPDNLPVLLHCEHGVGRTGVLSALYRMEFQRWSVDEALEEARFYAFGGSYFDGQDKTEFLLDYVPRWARGADASSGSSAP